MQKKILGILVCTLLIASVFGSASVLKNENSEDDFESFDIDRSLDYFITAVDHPDVLDDSRIDNIAYVTLYSGNDVDISSIKIFITNNKKDFLKTKIVERGTWRIGEQITIREIYSDEVTVSCYSIMVVTAEEIHPLAEYLVRIDNAPITAYDFFDRSNDMGQTYGSDLTPGDYKTSSCYSTDDILGNTIAAAALAVEYEGMDWVTIEDVSMWMYMFRIDGVCSIGPVWAIAGFNKLELLVDRPGSWGQGYGGKGAWNFDEGDDDHIGDWVYFVCEQAINWIEKIPLIGFALGWLDLAEELRDTPDIIWTADGFWPWDFPRDGSGCTYFFVYVRPEKTWEVQFNLGAGYAGFNYIDLDPSSDNGQGKIVFGETSPPEPANDPPRKPTRPFGLPIGYTGIAFSYFTRTSDPNGDDIYFKWDWDDGTFSDWMGAYRNNERCQISHAWAIADKYDIKVKAKDDPNGDGDLSDGLESEWSLTRTVVIIDPDTTPPDVEITKPELGIYVDNVKVMPFPITIIVGWIKVEVQASDTESGMNRVEFYIDDELKAEDDDTTDNTYIWTWDEFSFGGHTLKVIAYDNFHNNATDEMKVWKFF